MSRYILPTLIALYVSFVPLGQAEDENQGGDAEIRITFLFPSGENILIFWKTDQAGTYQLQSSSNLLAWVDEATVDAIPGTHMFTVPGMKPHTFLRIQQNSAL